MVLRSNFAFSIWSTWSFQRYSVEQPYLQPGQTTPLYSVSEMLLMKSFNADTINLVSSMSDCYQVFVVAHPYPEEMNIWTGIKQKFMRTSQKLFDSDVFTFRFMVSLIKSRDRSKKFNCRTLIDSEVF